MLYKRKARFVKKFSFFFLFLMLFQMFAPTQAYALTSGPSQPEVQSFEPFGTSEMVNLFSGDFTYNIPLFELPGPNGGYPFNLAYHSGVGMDQEASWVGLGWSLNPGAINRNMRGLPDDFNGDEIVKTLSMKDHVTYGVSAGAGLGIADFPMSFNASLKIYYNSYKGMGFTIDQGVRLTSGNSESPASAGIGLNLSLDSQEGATITPSLSLSVKASGDKASGSLGLGASMSFNSNRGLGDLNLSMNVSVSSSKGIKKSVTDENGVTHSASRKAKGTEVSMSSGRSISFSNSAYSPTIGNPMKGVNIVMSGHFGIDFASVNPNFSGSGFFKKRKLKENVTYNKAFGYLNLVNASDSDLLDFNREKDAAVMLQTPNLAMTSLTYDVYSVQGQGVGGTYRPYRNDLGIVYDQKVESNFDDGSVGAEGGIPVPPSLPGSSLHFAINAENTHSHMLTSKWSEDNAMISKYDFIKQEDKVNSEFEDVYWKQPGEPVSEDVSRMTNLVGNEEAVRIAFNGYSATDSYVDSDNNEVNIWGNTKRKSSLKRKPRNIGILPLKNSDLRASNTTSYLSEFNNMEYYDATSNSNPNLIDFDRSEKIVTGHSSPTNKLFKDDHIGGITAINTSGSRYVYGLPVYNKENKTVTFAINNDSNNDKVSDYNCSATSPLTISSSVKVNHKTGVSGSDDYYSKTELPPYAYSYLLTAIVGPDYVDLTNDGLTNDDFGYWVKFNYQKTESNYAWRAPFKGANYMEGHKSIVEDDKGSYMYGTKEIYYLATAETKSHIAVFNLEDRDDARGAANELNGGIPANSSYKSKALNNVRLYVKNSNGSNDKSNYDNAEYIKSIEFEYDNSLCKNVDNNNTGLKGKLTLKELRFKNGSSNRGELNPYQFIYESETPIAEDNPDYSPYAIDRWGNYKPINGDACSNLDFPYVDQYNRAQADKNVAAWNMKKIIMPSGGEINVEYEADDYAYVQNVPATNMFEVMQIGSANPNSGKLPINNIKDAAFPPPYAPPSFVNYKHATINPNNENERIYFKLKEPLDPTLPATDIGIKLLPYVQGLDKVYFKSLMNLRHDNANPFNEFVSGYINFNKTTGVSKIALAPNSVHDLNSDNLQEWAYVTFDYQHKVHPFSHAALLKLRNQFDSRYSKQQVPAIMDENNNNPLTGIKTMMGMVGDVVDLFTNYNKLRIVKGFAQESVAGKTWIKLNTPDKFKIGGGSRVKKISINDKWNDPVSNPDGFDSEYGQVYDYTTTEKGALISSGIATYEPIQGGDENALKSEKTFEQVLSGRENLLEKVEYPVNESYYPGASVGYSKVTVRSLNTDNILKYAEDNSYSPDAGGSGGDGIGFSSTGVTINEFYTAKDFPVISHETKLSTSKKTLNMFNGNEFNGTSKKIEHINESLTPLPFGNVTDKLITSQGYSLVLNNMHGKQKNVSNFALDKNGFRESQAYSSVSYEYSSTKKYDGDGNPYYVLDNVVDVLLSDEDPSDSTKAEIAKKRIATDYEMFNDMRYSSTNTETGGVTVKTEMYFGPAPVAFIPYIPLIIPLPTVMFTKSETKIATTNKIIEKSGILTKTVAYNDGVTLTTENKLFDAVTGKPLLTTVQNNYEKPIYSYTIPAHWKYDDLGSAYKNLGVEANVTIPPSATSSDIYDCAAASYFLDGDECLAFNSNGEVLDKVYVVSVDYTNKQIQLEKTEDNTNYTDIDKLMIVRSARKNQLEADVANVVSLADPTKGRVTFNCEHSFDPVTGEVESGEEDCSSSLNLIPDVNCAEWVFADNIRYLMNAFAGYNNDRVGPSDPPNVVTYTNLLANQPHVVPSTVPLFLDEDALMQNIIFNENEIILERSNGANCYFDIVDLNGNLINLSSILLEGNVIFSLVNETLLPMYYPVSSLQTINGKYVQITITTTTNTYYLINSDLYCICFSCLESEVNDTNPPSFISDDIYTLDSVLQVSASTFSDDWPRNFKQIKGLADPTEIEGLALKNKFRSGQRGIWRNENAFAYLENRKGIDPNEDFEEQVQSNVELNGDGIFDVIMYKWDGSAFANDCAPAWIQTNQVTKYNSYGFETENRDVLNNYSSALYGYKGSLPTAVSVNAMNAEIGFESFEELPEDATFTQNYSSEGNIDLYNSYDFGGAPPYEEIHVGNTGSGTADLKVMKITLPEEYLSCPNYTPLSQSELEFTNVEMYAHGTKRVVDYALVNQLYQQWRSGDWAKQTSDLNRWGQLNPKKWDVMAATYKENYVNRFNYITTNLCHCETATVAADGICNETEGGLIPLAIPMLNNAQELHLPVLPQPYSYYTNEVNISTIYASEDDNYDNNITSQIFVPTITPLNDYSLNAGNITNGSSSSYPHTIISDDLENILLSFDNLDIDNCKISLESDINVYYNWSGILKVPLVSDNVPDNNYDFMSITDEVAHTGKKSMKIIPYTTSGSNTSTFPQSRMQFNSGEKYILSAWVYKDLPTSVPSYEDVSIKIRQYDCVGDDLPNEEIILTPTGPIINGWQKIEGSFDMALNSTEIGLQFITESNAAFFDDLRIHPIDATMQTYVYNTDNYKLEATLDNNNYATLNYYDEAGNLFLVKKETAKGIKTIQESRSYLKATKE